MHMSRPCHEPVLRMPETAHHAPGEYVVGQLVELPWRRGSQPRNAWRQEDLEVVLWRLSISLQ